MKNLIIDELKKKILTSVMITQLKSSTSTNTH